MAITLLSDNHPPARFAGSAPSTTLVDRWTLTGISPCCDCACTCDGRVDR